MAEYLDKQELLKVLNDRYNDMSAMPASYYAGFQYSIKLIERLHVSEEVAPVRHGKWKLCYEDDRHQIEGDECTACGFQQYGTVINHYRYCPACGAVMDLEENPNDFGALSKFPQEYQDQIMNRFCRKD